MVRGGSEGRCERGARGWSLPEISKAPLSAVRRIVFICLLLKAYVGEMHGKVV